MALDATVQELRARVRAIEAPRGHGRAISLGTRALGTEGDGLPGMGLPDLPLGCLHEMTGEPGDFCAPTGFAAALLTRLSHQTGPGNPVLWCLRAHESHEHGALYAPGLDDFGLAPEQILVVRARTETQVLWAMEEGLRSSGLGAVVGEVDNPSLTASRRLQLAAEASGVTALMLRPDPKAAAAAASGAVTRWHVTSASTRQEEEMETPRWRVELVRHRGGDLGAWDVEWRNETGDFFVAAPVHDGPAQPHPAQMAG